MSETTVKPENINTHEMFKYLKEQVETIDLTLAANDDSKRAAKDLIKKTLIQDTRALTIVKDDGEETTVGWPRFVEQIIQMLENFEESETKLGLFFGVVDGLTEKYGKSGTALLDSKYAAQQKVAAENVDPNAPPVQKASESEITELLKQRTGMMEQMRLLRSLNIMMNFGKEEDYVMPPKRGGGKRGKRAISLVDWFVNGEPFDKGTDSSDLLALAKKYAYGTPTDLKKDLLAQMKVADFKKLPAPAEGSEYNIVATMHNGDLLQGKAQAGAPIVGTETESDADEGEDDDDDDDDDEETTEENSAE